MNVKDNYIYIDRDRHTYIILFVGTGEVFSRFLKDFHSTLSGDGDSYRRFDSGSISSTAVPRGRLTELSSFDSETWRPAVPGGAKETIGKWMKMLRHYRKTMVI